MMIAGLGVMTVGTVGIAFAVVEEWRKKEPIYMLIMKIAAGLFGVGGVLFGVAMST